MGGLLVNANLVENYPGFPTGIPGPELVNLFIRQAHNLNVMVTNEEIVSLAYDKGLFQASTRHRGYTSQVVVIATGTKPLLIEGFHIPDNLSSRVYYEVYPLTKVEGKCVVIVGGGDAAFDYGLNLSKKNQVVILNRADTTKCLPLLWERAQKVKAITYHAMTSISHIEDIPGEGILLNCRGPSGNLQLNADYLLVAIGREPQMDCLSEGLRQKAQELEKQEALFMIGDVKNGIFRQTSIAVGDGVLAAMKICRRLKENR